MPSLNLSLNSPSSSFFHGTSAPVYDADALDYASRTGCSDATKDAVSTFISSCKSQSIWNNITHAWLLCGSSSATNALKYLKGSVNGSVIQNNFSYDQYSGLFFDTADTFSQISFSGITNQYAFNTYGNGIPTGGVFVYDRNNTANGAYASLFQVGSVDLANPTSSGINTNITQSGFGVQITDQFSARTGSGQTSGTTKNIGTLFSNQDSLGGLVRFDRTFSPNSNTTFVISLNGENSTTATPTTSLFASGNTIKTLSITAQSQAFKKLAFIYLGNASLIGANNSQLETLIANLVGAINLSSPSTKNVSSTTSFFLSNGYIGVGTLTFSKPSAGDIYNSTNGTNPIYVTPIVSNTRYELSYEQNPTSNSNNNFATIKKITYSSTTNLVESVSYFDRHNSTNTSKIPVVGWLNGSTIEI